MGMSDEKEAKACFYVVCMHAQREKGGYDDDAERCLSE